MKTHFLTTVIAAILPAVFAASAFGQQECRVRALSLQAGAVEPQLHAHNEAGTATAGTVRVKTFLNHEADTLKLKGSKLVFTAKPAPGSARDPEDRIGECEIPAKAKSVILLFLPQLPGKPACRVVVVEDSAKAFPAGSVMVANLASLPVQIQLEQKSFDFKPGEIRAIPDPPVGASQASAMSARVKRAGKWEDFSSGAWPHPGDKRVLQVLTENPGTKRLEIRGIRDVAEPG